MKNFFKKNSHFIFFPVFLCVFFPFAAGAATAVISASANTVEVGKTITVYVSAASANQSINAASGNISYPANLVSVTSVSTAGSIFGQWLPPGKSGPTVSSGTIHFEGVSLGGYQGASGRMFAITFVAKAVGDVSLSFSGLSILANDGAGTNVTQASNGASFKVIAAAAKPVAPTPVPTVPVQTAPIVSEPAVVVETPIAVTQTIAPTSQTLQDILTSTPLLWPIVILLAIIIFLLLFIVILVVYLIFLSRHVMMVYELLVHHHVRK